MTDPLVALREALATAIEDEWPLQWENDHDGTRRTFDQISDVLLRHPKVRAALESIAVVSRDDTETEDR